MTRDVAPIETDFTKMFGIDYPIIGAPMFLVSYADLVVAMCEAGGLGAFPALNYRPVENFKKAVIEIKSRTKKPFGVNLIVQKSNSFQHAQLDIILEHKVPLIITSLGSPREIIKKAHEVGSKVFCDVIGLEHAKKVADLGADGLIAVGGGAGGHAGETSLLALIPYLKRNINLPVVAAGSISDGPTMLSAMALGASAVYMGTRIIASRESPASEGYKNAILKSGPEDIVNTDKVDGFPGNFIMTPELAKLGLKDNLIESVVTRIPKVKRWISLARAARSLMAGDKSKVSYKNVFSAGHGVGLIDEILTVEEIVSRTVKEYNDLKGKLP
jgi:nitronate monooxygenase